MKANSTYIRDALMELKQLLSIHFPTDEEEARIDQLVEDLSDLFPTHNIYSLMNQL